MNKKGLRKGNYMKRMNILFRMTENPRVLNLGMNVIKCASEAKM